MTEADLQPQAIPEETMEAALRERRVVIVGGHDNWVHFLKEKFPSWTYIKPGIANTVPESAVMNAEYLFLILFHMELTESSSTSPGLTTFHSDTFTGRTFQGQ